jgi:hypothetical protein
MDTELLEQKFRRMGARAKISRSTRQRVAIDIGRDRKGEFFDLAVNAGVAVNAIDVRPREQHLLLVAHDEDRLGLPVGQGQRFLCGHDERDWFVAAVPEGRPASNVAMAMDALKPRQALWAEERVQLRFDRRHQRHNAAWIRQGEWFFVPAPRLQVDLNRVIRNEMLVRTGGGKPHIAEFCVRRGGDVVYRHRFNGKVIGGDEFGLLRRSNPREAQLYTSQRRDMRVYVRGRVRHEDHKTILLDGWHEVAMNTESQSIAKKSVVFID